MKPLLRSTTVLIGAVALIGALGAPPATAGPADRQPATTDGIGRQVLADRDGWASANGGTTGGAAADAAHVVTVSTRDQLAAAAAGDTPKIIYVDGAIDANSDSAGHQLSCADYARDGYTLQKYLDSYDPAVWGRDAEPSGPVEDARAASQQAQAARIRLKIGSNTTIIGRPGASITGAMLDLSGVSNVIIRGLTLSDAHDCFPSWDPTDGADGNWNSEYDLISLRGASHVWVDHNDLSDGDNPDSAQPLYFGRPYQVHDGTLDITNGSDLVTVSYNRIHDHDKTMLIGSSDSRTSDARKLRVTVHHNLFRDVGQRVPRVRYGQVDVYNNHFVTDAEHAADYVYSWGVGAQSHILSERNAVDLPASIDADRVIGNYGGSSLTENDNLLNGEPVDLLAAYNAARSDKPLTEVPAWSPLLRRTVHPACAVARVVDRLAGPDRLGVTESITVAGDGSGDVTTVQAAVDQAPADSVDRVTVLIKPGRYQGRVVVDAAHTRLSFVGTSGDPADVVITNDNAAGTPKPGGGTWGTSGSASVTLAGAEFQARAVTFENAFDEAAHPEFSGHQAVAVKTAADRISFEHCRFLGNQDTLYLDSPAVDVPARVYLHNSWIQGDVDFIFGRATAVIDDSMIKALRRDSDPSGYVTAPSTSSGNPHGFLITNSTVLSDAGPGSYYLGRPWHPSSAPDNNPRVIIRNSWLPAAIRTDDPWTTMSGYDWIAGSNAEYRNSGPGATVNANRPQLTDAEAADQQVDDYLSGSDGWAPQSAR